MEHISKILDLVKKAHIETDSDRERKEYLEGRVERKNHTLDGYSRICPSCNSSVESGLEDCDCCGFMF